MSCGDAWLWAERTGTPACGLCTHTSRLSSPTCCSAGLSPFHNSPQGRSIEFVVNNGAGEWDSPAGGPGRNYTINTPGQYRLHYGTITQTAPWSP